MFAAGVDLDQQCGRFLHLDGRLHRNGGKHNPAGTATGLAVWGATLRTVVVVALIGLIFAIPAASTLVDSAGQVTAAAAGADPNLTAEQNATVKAVAADPSIVTKVQALAAQYKPQLATAAKLKPATAAALTATPNAPTVQAQALSEISGLPVSVVAKVVALGAQYQDQLATAATMDPATQKALLTNPGDTTTQAKAVAQIAKGLGIAPAAAIGKLQALAQVPPADLAFMAANAAPVQTAATQLTALAKVPAADLAYLQNTDPVCRTPPWSPR